MGLEGGACFHKRRNARGPTSSQIELHDGVQSSQRADGEIPEEQMFWSHYNDEMGDLETTKAGPINKTDFEGMTAQDRFAL